MSTIEKTNNAELELARRIGEFRHDPLAFVLFAFPWGEGEGPDTWQEELLRAIGEGSLNVSEALQAAVSSGHGIGKTAFVAWVILWAMSTRPHLAGVVTANTSKQLEDKTWRELAVWHKKSINGHWFKWTATKFYQVDNPETWFMSAVPWSKERPEAFAGLHAEHVLVIFDEASAVDDVIWETASGAMTTPGAIWLVLGNPTRNTGRFHGCFNRFKHRWMTRQIDSRTAKMANKKQIQQWVDDYGEDSDFVRVRVRGVFPRSGSCQLISSSLVDEASARVLRPDVFQHAAKIIGVDVARFGDDQCALIKRQGLQAFGLKSWRGIDTMTYAGLIAQEIVEFSPDAVFIDLGAMGAGVYDRLIQLGHKNVIGVNFGGESINKVLYMNKRIEMWALMNEWLKNGGAIPDDVELHTDLTAPEYGFTGDKSQMYLEKKEDMKKRGLASPDKGDALALTFAQPVMPASARQGTRRAVSTFEQDFFK